MITTRDTQELRKLATSQGFKLEKKRSNRNRWDQPEMFRLKTSAGRPIGGAVRFGFDEYNLTASDVEQFLTLPAVPVMQLERIKFEVMKMIEAEAARQAEQVRYRAENQAELASYKLGSLEPLSAFYEH